MLQVDVKNLLHIRKRFEGVHDSLKTISPSLSAAVQQVLQTAFREILDAEGIPKWVKLSPYTLREKQRLGYGGKRILQRTNRLRRSYSARSSDSQWRTTSASIIFENYLPYAGFHETGGQRGSEGGRPPARHIIKGILERKAVVRGIREAIAAELKDKK